MKKVKKLFISLSLLITIISSTTITANASICCSDTLTNYAQTTKTYGHIHEHNVYYHRAVIKAFQNYNSSQAIYKYSPWANPGVKAYTDMTTNLNTITFYGEL